VNPLDPEIIAAFKDHYASNGKVIKEFVGVPLATVKSDAKNP